MPLQEVKNYLVDEASFLTEAITKVEDLLTTHTEPLDQAMYGGWLAYFEELSEQNTRQQSWKKGRFKKSLEAELDSHDLLLGVLDKALVDDEPALHYRAHEMLGNLRALVVIEREATQRMLDEVKA